VTHEEAIQVVERTFGKLPAGTLKKERGPSEPPQREFRYGETYADIRQSFSVFGWHTPGEGSEEDETLELLSSVLGSGRSSRFYREVVGQGGANIVSAFNTVFEDIGIFTVRANYEDANLEEVEHRILTEIERMKKFGPTEYELQLAKNRSESSLVFELEDVLGQAQMIAYFEARGSYEDIRKHIAKIRAVTPEMIRAAAENLPSGPHRAPAQPIPPGRCALSAVEGWRGEIIHWIRTGPENRLERCHIKDPSVNNWPALVEAVEGNIIADFPVINKSFNLSYSGTDR
jgi:predicted Zn-dependent peptidase